MALVNSIKHTEKKLGQEPDVVAVYDTKLKTEQVYSFDPEPTRCSVLEPAWGGEPQIFIFSWASKAAVYCCCWWYRSWTYYVEVWPVPLFSLSSVAKWDWWVSPPTAAEQQSQTTNIHQTTCRCQPLMALSAFSWVQWGLWGAWYQLQCVQHLMSVHIIFNRFLVSGCKKLHKPVNILL